MPQLSRITVYPIKSLPPLSLDSCPFITGGGLRYDRQWALTNAQGEFVNAKRTPRIHTIRCDLDLRHRLVTLATPAKPATTLHLDQQRSSVEDWFSDHFGERIRLIENTTMGFPDDIVAPGPTVVATSTLETVATWFPGWSLEEVRLRFRANLEISGVPPFWEDRLYAAEGNGVRFRIGEALLEGVNPCQRCVVPTRDPETGAITEGLSRRFSEFRRETLPNWASRDRFDHFYRLTTNTRLIGSPNCLISVGDEVTLEDSAEFPVG